MAEDDEDYQWVDDAANPWGEDKTVARGPIKRDLKWIGQHLRDEEDQNWVDQEELLRVMAGETVSQDLQCAMSPTAVNDFLRTLLFSAVRS